MLSDREPRAHNRVFTRDFWSVVVMPIEVTCSNCSALLRVSDRHAGKNARCPQCSTINPIPLQVEDVDEFASAESYSPGSSTWDSGKDNPYSAPPVDQRVGQHAQRSGDDLKEHRGGTVLTVGILSLVCCPLLGISAILMANRDLEMMQLGMMDPAGRGTTEAGKVVGIVGLVMAAIGICVQIFFILVMGIAGIN